MRNNEKAGTAFLILPCRRRLRDINIKPQCSFNSEIVDELRTKIKSFSENEKFVLLLTDDMKIYENLVQDKHSGELIVYVGLEDVNLKYAAT